KVAALRASERLYRTLAASAPDISILLIDRSLDCRLVEGAALGWSRGELGDALRGELADPVRTALGGESTYGRWSSEDSHYSLLLGPFAEPGRGVTHAICIVRDISAKVAGEAELEEQRSFLSSLLGQLSDRVFACDANGRLLAFGAQDAVPDMHP